MSSSIELMCVLHIVTLINLPTVRIFIITTISCSMHDVNNHERMNI